MQPLQCGGDTILRHLIHRLRKFYLLARTAGMDRLSGNQPFVATRKRSERAQVIRQEDKRDTGNRTAAYPQPRLVERLLAEQL